LALLASGERFDLIFSDVMMQNMTGIEFYEALLGTNPDLAHRVVFLSGGAVTPKADAFLHSVPNRLIGKPFTVRDLRNTIEEVLRSQLPANPS
jgi:CheY-like chemotaxis protein